LHGCALAELLGIATVLVPPAPGVLCAEGLLAAEPRAEFSRTLAGADDWSPAEAAFRALEADAEAWFNEEGVKPPERRMRRVVLLRYAGQGGELTVSWQNDPVAVRTAFAEAHERLNGFVLDNRIELVTVRLEAAGTVVPPARDLLPPGAGSAPESHQTAWFGAEPVEAAVYPRAKLGAGDHLVGPAIITQLDATTLLPPGWEADVLPSGALLLRHPI
jgi:N-methylhydantoinase A